MKLYEAIMDDGVHVYKALGTANSKKDFEKVYGGNGEIVRLKDITKDYFDISNIESILNNLNSDLDKMQWGEGERRIICALLEEHMLKNMK